MTLLRRPCRHDGGEQRDHAGIEPIVLGQNAGCLGELPQLERVDLALPPLAFSAAAAAAAPRRLSAPKEPRLPSPITPRHGGFKSMATDAEIEAAVNAMRAIRTSGGKVHDDVLRAYARAALKAAELAQVAEFQSLQKQAELLAEEARQAAGGRRT